VEIDTVTLLLVDEAIEAAENARAEKATADQAAWDTAWATLAQAQAGS
jgi:hypothetical protein